MQSGTTQVESKIGSTQISSSSSTSSTNLRHFKSDSDEQEFIVDDVALWYKII